MGSFSVDLIEITIMFAKTVTIIRMPSIVIHLLVVERSYMLTKYSSEESAENSVTSEMAIVAVNAKFRVSKMTPSTCKGLSTVSISRWSSKK